MKKRLEIKLDEDHYIFTLPKGQRTEHIRQALNLYFYLEERFNTIEERIESIEREVKKLQTKDTVEKETDKAIEIDVNAFLEM